MEKKILYVVLSVIILLIFLMLLFYVFYEKDKVSINVEDFKDFALNANCADKTNDLFIIDNKMVLWIVEGSCSDASYSYTLFGNNTDQKGGILASSIRLRGSADYKSIKRRAFQIFYQRFGYQNFRDS